MAIGRVNAPLGDYFVGDTIKPEHITIELETSLEAYRENYNEYTKNREYSDGLIVGKDKNIYMLITGSFSNYLYKFDNQLKTVWRRKVENAVYESLPNLYYNYHKNIMYLHQKKRIIAIDMNANVIKTIDHEGPFTWDDKGNTYLLSSNSKMLTVQKLNSSFNREWSEDYLYSDSLRMHKVFYFHDGYIYMPNKKINVNNRKMEESFDFREGTTNDKQNIACIIIGDGASTRKSRVFSNNINYEFKGYPVFPNVYVSDKGEVVWLNNSVVFKVAEPGIVVNITNLARRDREVRHMAGNNDIIYVSGAESFSSSAISDYGFISSYKTGGIEKITITGRD